jgi:hypothetical protein
MYAPKYALPAGLLAQASSKLFHVLFVDINHADGFFNGLAAKVPVVEAYTSVMTSLPIFA